MSTILKDNESPGSGLSTTVNAPHQAIIEGNHCNISNFDGKGNLATAEGRRYTFALLNPGTGIPSTELLEIAKLKRVAGDWYLNGERLPLQKWLRLELQRFYAKRGIPASRLTDDAMKTAMLRAILNGDPNLPTEFLARRQLQSILQTLNAWHENQVVGVAWFKCDDGADGRASPILLREFQELPPAGLNEQTAALAAVGEWTKAAATVQAANCELRATADQIKTVMEPLREMYRDDRVASARAEALKLNVPDLLIDTITAIYHKEKFPTIDKLLRYVHSSQIAPKLKAARRGTSRANVARWLKIVRKQFERRGLIQPRAAALKKAAHYDVNHFPTPALEDADPGQEPGEMTDDDTDFLEPGE